MMKGNVGNKREEEREGGDQRDKGKEIKGKVWMIVTRLLVTSLI